MYNWIEEKYNIEYENLIDEFRNFPVNSGVMKISKDSPIWIFWWQGMEAAPNIVKKCLNSVKQCAENHKIIIISKENYKEYADIPDYIIDKVNTGKISLTHFSDILRLELLYKNGGIWMDATLWMTGRIPTSAYDFPFFTIKHGKYSDYHVCRGKWSTFFMGAGKNNPLIKFCRDFHYEYWKKENSPICYLLLDIPFCIAYDNFEWAKLMIDAVPENGTMVFAMQENMNSIYDSEQFKQWCENTYVHKVSYKIPFEEEKDGKDTELCLKMLKPPGFLKRAKLKFGNAETAATLL